MCPDSLLRGLRAATRPAVCIALVAIVPAVVAGIFTKEQAERGRTLYDASCAACHGAELQGGTSAPLAGEQFLMSWGRPDLTLDDFYYIVRKTMPKESAGTLSSVQYSEIVAYILSRNGFPAGDRELTPDPVLMRSVRFVARDAPLPPSITPPSR